MESLFIGRAAERTTLQAAFSHPESRFVAVYGRRRVGKTYLIRHELEGKMTFQMAGGANANTAQQLNAFRIALKRHGLPLAKRPSNWFDAFEALTDFLAAHDHPKKVVFIDELPWLATKRSDFLQALEHFWNSWASARRDVLLVVCGSSASWMVNELLKNKGGLHNRVTDRIRLEPFNLYETEAFLLRRNPTLDRYSVVLLYMVMGGIPFYLDAISGAESAAQNIDRLCFSPGGALREEFDFLLQSLFLKADHHLDILKALEQKTKGLTRAELVATTKLHNSGRLTMILNELEQSGFIRIVQPFGGAKRDVLYRLSDFYTSFYFKFLHGKQPIESNNWLNAIESGKYQAWKGFAFEQVCMNHIRQIKSALGILGVVSQSCSWQNEHAQIDLLIDRRDRVINLIEVKFTENRYEITADYAARLSRKIEAFRTATATNKTLVLTFLTPFGVQPNAHSAAMVQQGLEMGVLFGE
jgi:uncharacterized protein